MLTREAPNFIWALSTCERVFAVVEFGVTDKKAEVSDGAQRQGLFHLRTLEQSLDGLGLKATLAAVKRTIGLLESGDMTNEQLGRANQDIYRRFQDEMEGRHFFLLTEKEAAFFDAKQPPFGESVADTFTTSVFDIEEADKCLAVGRYTACVFHLMRAAEAASVVVAEKLEATTHNDSGEQLPLGILTANIDTKIGEMKRGGRKDDWLKIPYLLHSCNRAYRTKTAHPADVYTGEQAESARQATCALLQELAELVNQKA